MRSFAQGWQDSGGLGMEESVASIGRARSLSQEARK